MKEKERIDLMKMENQLGFSLYVASKELVRAYRPYLDEIGLTFTQYLVMTTLWEEKKMSVKELGEKLFLDSGTLTPVLKVLEKKGLVTRKRSFLDERVLDLELTPDGEKLRQETFFIPAQVTSHVKLTLSDALQLGKLLDKIISGLSSQN